MKFDANQKFEIKASAFESMRMMLAPGKDQREGPSSEVRVKEWWEWNDKYGKVFDYIIAAVEKHV